MALRGNKGEWSEIYAHFKLLADGVLYSGDENLNILSDFYFPIIKILRVEDKNSETVYCFDKANKKILIEGTKITISQNVFKEMAEKLYESIVSAKSDKFIETLCFPEIEDFMNSVSMFHLKAKSSDKKDIKMVVHDFRTTTNPELGFSIKSKLGGKSTLFNSNKNGTNFRYLITGNISEEQIKTFNETKEFKNKFALLKKWKCTVSFDKIMHSVFNDNLTFIDRDLILIIAYSLIGYYSHEANSSRTQDVVKYVSNCNPCGYNTDLREEFYFHKMKQFLLIVALGMTANTHWDGKYDANGGYIVVKEDGNIVCYHFYDRNQLENYLMMNTAFDTPSTSRHEFGYIEKDEQGNLFLKLNLLIRFILEK